MTKMAGPSTALYYGVMRVAPRVQLDTLYERSPELGAAGNAAEQAPGNGAAAGEVR
jgi:hypothetical protein